MTTELSKWTAAEPVPGGTALTVCAECGSPLVEVSAWVNVNTGEDCGGGGPVDGFFCAGCDCGEVLVAEAVYYEAGGCFLAVLEPTEGPPYFFLAAAAAAAIVPPGAAKAGFRHWPAESLRGPLAAREGEPGKDAALKAWAWKHVPGARAIDWDSLLVNRV